MGVIEVMQLVLMAGIGFFVWCAIASKEWGFLVGLAALIIIPISSILISTFPVAGFGAVYGLWFILLFSSRGKIVGDHGAQESVSSVVWKAALYAFVTVLIAFALNAFFGGGSGGGCSRATPQFC
ncbi:hypothetical protein MIH18_12450 [Marinobacter sp. M3C]|uniref:hypothetical protein n=1 Tax=Marinobacter sp. M3C TaxID=2917715 RepID=UPI00200CB77D|nr:hypothetical protein [Marinobacter sp. M3C]UQG58575.1 hypothetical protein MIH18_12450 [Marinobacter sp. M3C]